MNFLIKQLSIILLLIFCSITFASSDKVVSLAGKWDFKLDPCDLGVKQNWAADAFPNTIHLPGSTDQAGFGQKFDGIIPDTIPFEDRDAKGKGRTVFDYFLVGDLTRLYKYTGPAWYAKDIQVPQSWNGKYIELLLERCHWQSRVWVNGTEIGTAESLSVPHVYDLGRLLKPGKNRVVIRIDNRILHNIVEGSHAVSEHTQTNWNGIIGNLELRASDPVYVSSVQVYPDIQASAAQTSAKIANSTALQVKGRLAFYTRLTGSKEFTRRTSLDNISLSPNTQSEFAAPVPMGSDVKLWDEFNPALYDIKVEFESASGLRDSKIVRFGMRSFVANGSQFEINSRPIFLRGTLEGCVFPKTAYPSMDKDSWLRIFNICRSYGLNHVRFHSWCPPEAAFAAADETGFLLHIELPLANRPNMGSDADSNDFLTRELDCILDTYGNHPSFAMMCMGNELLGDFKFLENLERRGQASDKRHLYTCTTARKRTPADDYLVTHYLDWVGKKYPLNNYRFTMAARYAKLNGENPTTDWDYSESLVNEHMPIIAHEITQWQVYPNFAEIPKYNGVLRAANFEFFKKELTRKGMLDQAQDFYRATASLSIILDKDDMEADLRTPKLAGFQMLAINDYPGMGTAICGVLDPFWDSKGFITPQQFRRFCNYAVPLARITKRQWTTAETFTAQASFVYYGQKPIENAKPVWSLQEPKGKIIASGDFNNVTIPLGTVTDLGKLSAPLKDVKAPAKLVLTISLKGTEFSNSWDIWVYHEKLPAPASADIVVTSSWTDAGTALNKGSKVLYFCDVNDPNRTVPGTFSSIFWSPMLFPAQKNHTMGHLIDNSHPAMSLFPTEYHTNWQWYDIISSGPALIIDSLPQSLRPIVQPIDNLMQNRRLAAIFETKVGDGKLLVCTFNLTKNMEKRPAARQLRHSLIQYMTSNKFDPRITLTLAQLTSIFVSKDNLAGITWVDINDPGVSGHEGFKGQMSKYETTNAQYCQYLNAAKASNQVMVYNKVVYAVNDTCHSKPYYNLAGVGNTFDGDANAGAARIKYTGSLFTVDNDFENHPVTYVSWYGATAFCKYYGYRLPTDWEWQAVADYDGSFKYGCGTNITTGIANHVGSTHPDGTAVVGSFGSYGYGICDLSGNAYEWTSSIYKDDSKRVLRGGSWFTSDLGCSVAYQGDSSPDGMFSGIGFRVCR